MGPKEAVKVALYHETTTTPYLDGKCFHYLTNFTRATFLRGKMSCRKKPGSMIEILFLIGEMVGLEVEYLVANGWAPTSRGDSVSDLVSAGVADLSLPQFWYSNFKAMDKTPVSFVPPFNQEPGICFTACSRATLYPTPLQGFQRINNLFGSAFALFVLCCVLGTATYYLLHLEMGSHHNRPRPRPPINKSGRILSKCNGDDSLRIFLDKITDFEHLGCIIWLPGWLTILFALLVWVQGYLEGELVASFTPRKRFPYSSLPDLARDLSEGKIRLGFQNAQVSAFSEVMTDPSFKEVRAALKKNPPLFYLEGLLIRRRRKPGLKFLDRVLFRQGTADARAFFQTPEGHSADCICSSIENTAKIPSGLILSPNKTKLRDRIEEKLTKAKEIGLLQKILNKYGFVDEQGVLETKHQIDASLQSLALPDMSPCFALLILGNLLAFCIANLECLAWGIRRCSFKRDF